LGGYFGPKSALAIASIAIVANLILLPITVVLLEVAQEENAESESSMSGANAAGDGKSGMSTAIRNGVLHAVKRPYVLAPVAAVVLVLLGLHVPPLATSMLELIGRTTSGISIFVAGLLLAAFRPKLNGVVGVNVILKSLVQPAMMIALVGLLSLSKPMAAEAVASVALPAAVITPMLAARYGTFQSEAGSNMLITSILMMFAVPISILIAR
jgi:predicted permease